MQLKLLAVLGKELTQRAGGNRIAGFLTTALANPQGELVIPALVSGSMAQPKFTPDAERVARLKVQSLLPSTGGSQAASPASGAAGAVKGLFDRFRKPREAAPQK